MGSLTSHRGSQVSTVILELERSLKQASGLEAKIDIVNEFYTSHRGAYRDHLSDLVSKLRQQAQIDENYYVLGVASTISGWIAMDSDLREQAITLFRQAQVELKEAGDKHKELRALNGEASALKQLGRVEETLNKYLDGLEQARAAQDATLIAVIGTNLGSFMASFGLFDEAIAYFQEVLALSGGDPSDFGSELYLMGSTYFKKGDYEQAEYYLQQGVQHCSKEGKDYLRALCLLDIASIKHARNLLEESKVMIQESLAVGQRLKIPSLEASALLELAKVEIKEKNYTEALRPALAALQIRRATGAKRPSIRVLLCLATIYEALEDYPQAYAALQEARQLEKAELDDNLINSLKIAKIKQVRRENMLYKELYERINAIGQIGRAITSTFAIEEVGQLIYENLKGLMPVNTLAIGAYNKALGEVEYKIFIRDGQFLPGFAGPLPEQALLHADKGEFGLQSQALILQHPGRSFLEANQSSLYAPLVIRNEVTGLVVVQSEKKDVYHQYHWDILRTLASYIAIALENGSLFAHVKKLASVDSLTGLHNRRVLFEMGEEEFKKAIRENTPLTVIMIDMDDLKKINDTYGHATGDRLLQATAKVFANTTAASDLLGRIGGDEFLLILPNSGLARAASLAKELRHNLSKATLFAGESPLSIRASIGVAEVNPGDTSIEQAVRRADRLLYASKRQGGDQVTSGN